MYGLWGAARRAMRPNTLRANRLRPATQQQCAFWSSRRAATCRGWKSVHGATTSRGHWPPHVTGCSHALDPERRASSGLRSVRHQEPTDITSSSSVGASSVSFDIQGRPAPHTPHRHEKGEVVLVATGDQDGVVPRGGVQADARDGAEVFGQHVDEVGQLRADVVGTRPPRAVGIAFPGWCRLQPQKDCYAFSGPVDRVRQEPGRAGVVGFGDGVSACLRDSVSPPNPGPSSSHRMSCGAHRSGSPTVSDSWSLGKRPAHEHVPAPGAAERRRVKRTGSTSHTGRPRRDRSAS